MVRVTCARGALVVAVTVSTLLAGGCAKKKPLPERGVVIGRARFKESAALEMLERQNIEASEHCLQIVKLRQEPKIRVIEMSSGACSSGLSNDVIATLRMTNISDAPAELGYMLVMGDSPIEAENTPVGLYQDASTHNELIVELSLCGNYKGRMKFPCELIPKDRRIKNLAVQKTSLNSTLLSMGIKNLENAEQIKQDISQVEAKISTLNTRINTANELIEKLEKRITTDDKNVVTLRSLIEATHQTLITLKEEMSAFTPDANKRILSLSRRLKMLKARYEAFVTAETSKKLSDIDAAIEATSKKLQETSKGATGKIEALHSQLETAVNGASKKVDELTKKLNELRAVKLGLLEAELQTLRNEYQVLFDAKNDAETDPEQDVSEIIARFSKIGERIRETENKIAETK